jgi:phosphate/phosphite/phosphonate ABC transporter binding protein
LTDLCGASNVRQVRIPVLRFGIVPVSDDDELRTHLQTMCAALGYDLGTTVLARRVPTYPKLVDLLTQSQIDAAWVPPVVAMDCDAKRIARPRIAMMRQGETSYSAALIARSDGPYRTVADLKDVRAAWVSPDSASGYLVPLASLRARGVSLSKAFREHIFFGSHAAVAQAVADGKADVGANFAHFDPPTFHKIRSSGWSEAGIDGPFRVLMVVGPIPTDVIVMHSTLSEEQAQALVAAMRWLRDKPAGASVNAIFKCDDLEPCTNEHLRGLRKLIRLLDRPSHP